MERLILPMLIIGSYLIYHGADTVRLAWGTSATPEVIRLADLLQRRGGNRHVSVTDFDMGVHFVAVGKKDSPIKDAFVPIWPAVPGGPEEQEGPPTGTPVAIVKDDSFSLQFFGKPKSTRGLVTGAVLGSDVRQMLVQKYPGVRLDQVPVIEARRSAPSPGFGRTLLGIGTVVVLVPLALLAYAVWGNRRSSALRQ